MLCETAPMNFVTVKFTNNLEMHCFKRRRHKSDEQLFLETILVYLAAGSILNMLRLISMANWLQLFSGFSRPVACQSPATDWWRSRVYRQLVANR